MPPIDEVVAYAESGQQFQLFERLCQELGGRNAALPKAWAGPGRESGAGQGRHADAAGAQPRRAGLAPAARLAAALVDLRRHPHHRQPPGDGQHRRAADRPGRAVGRADLHLARRCWRTVERILDSYGHWLRERLGATRLPRPMLPVIPLGIDCAALDPGPEASGRGAGRAGGSGWASPPQDLVVLFVGRLSWHAKAHPLPMYLGLEQAARRLGRAGVRLHLIESGWHANDWIRDGFAEAQQALMPEVRCHLVDGREPEARREIWHAADVFCSLSDNIQETYGLTPVEAMAAGPAGGRPATGTATATRWSTARRRCWCRPPCRPPAAGALFAERHEDGRDSYDHYCAQASLVTAVDVPATAQALTALLGDPQRRAAMGAAGRARAKALFDWRVVIGRYQELWAEQAAIRQCGRRAAPGGRPAHPLRDNPFLLFGHYADPARSGPRPGCAPWPSRRRPPSGCRLRMCRLDGRGPHPSPLTWRVLDRLRAAGAAGMHPGRAAGGLPRGRAPGRGAGPRLAAEGRADRLSRRRLLL